MPSIAGRVAAFLCSLWARSPLGSIYFFIHTTQKNVWLGLEMTSVQSAAESRAECRGCKQEQPSTARSRHENPPIGNQWSHLWQLCFDTQPTTNLNSQTHQSRKFIMVILSWNNIKGTEHQKISYFQGVILLCILVVECTPNLVHNSLSREQSAVARGCTALLLNPKNNAASGCKVNKN